MPNRFEELYNVLKKDRQCSAWSKQLTIPQRSKELQKEIEEVLEAIEKNDLPNLHEELGDVLWDLFAVLAIAEEQYHFQPDNIIKKCIAKMKKRKPWIFEGKSLSLAEENKKFAELKQREKKLK